jgi:protein SCO1/2
MQRLGTTAAMAMAVVCLLGARPAATSQFRGGLLDPPRPAADFTLTTQEGRPFTLSHQQGKVVALWFGYTFCPDVCPTTLAELTRAREQLGKDAERLRIVFVTVDPERDTPERLREYVKAFGGNFIAATGTPERLAQARKAYGVVAEKRVVAGTSAAYLIDHSAFVYVVDPAGRLRLMFPFGMSVEDMVHDFKLLLH